LSKASASVDEKTFSTILSAIPVTEILKAALIPGAAEVRTARTPYWEVGVAVQRQVLAVHRYRKELFGCDPLGPPLDDPLAQGVEYERGTPSAPAGKTPITFEGSGSATLSK
jgi:hypothetical protein